MCMYVCGVVCVCVCVVCVCVCVCVCVSVCMCVCEVSAVGKISDWFNSRPGRGLNFECSSLATPSVERDIKPLVWSLDVLSGDLKEPTHLSIRVG